MKRASHTSSHTPTARSWYMDITSWAHHTSVTRPLWNVLSHISVFRKNTGSGASVSWVPRTAGGVSRPPRSARPRLLCAYTACLCSCATEPCPPHIVPPFSLISCCRQCAQQFLMNLCTPAVAGALCVCAVLIFSPELSGSALHTEPQPTVVETTVVGSSTTLS